MKRTKGHDKCVNPLFEKWLIEWRNEARAKGSFVENQFIKAIMSLRKYPLRLESGRDCMILQHFGTKLCAMLDRRLKVYKEDGRNDVPMCSDTERMDTCDDVQIKVLPKKSSSLGSRSRNLRTSQNLLKKNEKGLALMSRRRVNSISSSDSNGHGSMLVEVSHNDGKCSRKVVAGKEKSESSKKKDAELERNSIAHEKKTDTATLLEKEKGIAAPPLKDEFHIAANNYDVILLVDVHETGSAKAKVNEDAIKSELDRLSTSYAIRHLKIGDFAWVARCRDTNIEVILPYIVERKRVDDLASSIKDGRFHEQKFRLKQSGIQNQIYMIESYGNNHHVGIPLPTLLQATINSLVQDGFTVKLTKNHRDSIQYLSILSNLICKIYNDKELVSGRKEDLHNGCASADNVPLMELHQFNKASSKVKIFNVREMFVRELLQLKGLSLEKVLAIVERYPTPVLLSKAFRSAGEGAEKLLATIKVGAQNKQLGSAISKAIYELYTKTRLE